jgi:serine/threonine-protein kinase
MGDHCECARSCAKNSRPADDGRHAAFLAGTVRLTVRSDPPEARVLCSRVRRSGRVWGIDPRVELGSTPLVDLPIGMGSYILTLECPGCLPTTVPVLIERCGEWGGDAKAVRLPREGELAPTLVYIPAGPFRCGGDPAADDPLPTGRPWVDGFALSRFAVTVEEYVVFLDDLHPLRLPPPRRRLPRLRPLHAGGRPPPR